MLRIAGYIDKAQAAEVAAEKVSTPSAREALLAIAHAWRQLADTMAWAIEAGEGPHRFDPA
jgi:hypothetical protein